MAGSPSFKASKDAQYDIDHMYKVGTPVTVYFDPRNPSFSLLKPGRAPVAEAGVFIGIFLCIAGIFYFPYFKDCRRKMSSYLGPALFSSRGRRI